MFRSIETKIAFFQITLLLFAILAISGTSYLLIERSIKEQLEERMSFAASTMARQTAERLTEGKEKFQEIARGKETPTYRLSLNDVVLRQYFKKYREDFPVLSYVNEQGVEEEKLVNGEPWVGELRNIGEAQPFIDAMGQPGHVIVSGVEKSPEINEPVLQFIVAAKDDSGKIAGVLSGSIPVQDLFKPVRALHLGEAGFASVLDKTGKVLSHPWDGLVLDQAKGDPQTITKILSAASASETTLIRANLDGVDGMVVSRLVPGTSWVVLVTMPYEEFIATPAALRNIAVVVALTVLILGIAVVFVVSRSVSKPIVGLTQLTEKIANEKNYEHRIDVRSHDEVGELATSFNWMLDTLAQDMAKRKRAEEALRTSEMEALRLGEENAVVAEIGRIIGSSLDLNEVYDRFAEQVRRLIPFDRIVIRTVDLEHGTLATAYARGADVSAWQIGEVRPLAGTSTEALIQTRSGLILEAESADPDDPLVLRFPNEAASIKAGLRSLVAVPLISRGNLKGALNLRSAEPRAYTERHLKLVERVGSQIAGAIANSELYTQRKQAEEALARQTQELERSNVELQQFAYVASHDLQEPLRMVASYTQLLARRYKGKLDSDADEFIAYAVDGATRMQTLINDLLSYSRVGTKGKEFEPTPCDAVLERALGNLRMAIQGSGAVVSHDSLPTVMADTSQLVQLFQNLVGNALKYHGKESPRVHVSAKRNGSAEWVFSVRDNGIGIDPRYAERIFVIFQRLHGKREYAGTGIGLSVCKKIVERHGGGIWVESQQGEGATFYFTMPEHERTQEVNNHE